MSWLETVPNWITAVATTFAAVVSVLIYLYTKHAAERPRVHLRLKGRGVGGAVLALHVRNPSAFPMQLDSISVLSPKGANLMHKSDELDNATQAISFVVPIEPESSIGQEFTIALPYGPEQAFVKLKAHITIMRGRTSEISVPVSLTITGHK